MLCRRSVKSFWVQLQPPIREERRIVWRVSRRHSSLWLVFSLFFPHLLSGLESKRASAVIKSQPNSLKFDARSGDFVHRKILPDYWTMPPHYWKMQPVGGKTAANRGILSRNANRHLNQAENSHISTDSRQTSFIQIEQSP